MKWMTTRVRGIWSDKGLKALNGHWNLISVTHCLWAVILFPELLLFVFLKAVFTELSLFPLLFFFPLAIYIYPDAQCRKECYFYFGRGTTPKLFKVLKGNNNGLCLFLGCWSLLIYGLCFQKRSLVDMYSLMGSWFSDTLARTITTTKQCLDLSVVMETTLISAYCAPDREYLHLFAGMLMFFSGFDI